MHFYKKYDIHGINPKSLLLVYTSNFFKKYTFKTENIYTSSSI